jgi:biopolymer transport protein ExbB
MSRSRVCRVLAALFVAIALPALAQEAAAEPTGVLSGDNLFDMFRKGGALMWPILACSVVMLAFVFERLVALRTRSVFPPGLEGDVREMIGRKQLAEAVASCRESRTPFGRLMYACLSRAGASGFEMEAALEEAGSRILYDLRRNGKPLGVIADIAPLLGLMGTVLGMIKAFDVVATTGALGRAELLAEGIGEALLTTAFGLIVAVPAIIFYHYFRGKAEGLVRAMEDACIELLMQLRQNGGQR